MNGLSRPSCAPFILVLLAQHLIFSKHLIKYLLGKPELSEICKMMGFLIHTTISFSSLTSFTVATEFVGFVLGVLHNTHLQSATSHSHLKERKRESKMFRYT